jgi:predicted metal-binding membrane protein
VSTVGTAPSQGADRRWAEGRDPFVVGLFVVSSVAWVGLAGWFVSPDGRYLNHRVLEHPISGPEAGALALGWLLMVAAMMLPTAAPLVRQSRRLGSGLAVPCLIVGTYVAAWAVFGLLAHLGDRSLHQTVDSHPWLGAHRWVVTAGTLAVAGAWQFSALKRRCLAHCRETAVALRLLRAAAPSRTRSTAVRVGADHGRYCLGSCWSLMLVMFALGMGNVAWMLPIALVMDVEKTAGWGGRITRPVGWVLLLCVALVVIAGAA